MSCQSSRSHVHGDWRLKRHQRAVAAEFIALQVSSNAQHAYVDAWEHVLAYEELVSRDVPVDDRGWRKRERDLRRLSHKIVPANKQAAAASTAEIHRAALRHIRKCGGVRNFNVATFVKEIASNPATHRVSRKSGVSRPLGDHAVRAILKKRLGFAGERGRKRTTL